jgi:uncharacterized membrane protein
VFALLAAQRQAGFAVDPVHPLLVHLLAFTAEQIIVDLTPNRITPRALKA